MKKALITSIFISLSICPLDLQAKTHLRSIRLRAARPATFHELILEDFPGTPKTTFNLSPVNNERLGLFLDFNQFIIGYFFDPFNQSEETKTFDFEISSEKYTRNKIGLNIQILEGFETQAENQDGFGSSTLYRPDLRSTRLELFGLHDLKDLNNSSLFDHFFLNRPKSHSKNFFDVSLVTNWGLRYLKIKDNNGLLFSTDFFSSPPPSVTEIEALSAYGSLGPLFSVGFKNNFSFFFEGRIGLGYFQNLDEEQGLKESGEELISSLGTGTSWLSKNEKVFVVLKAWYQEGRHIGTLFGDLSFIYFF